MLLDSLGHYLAIGSSDKYSVVTGTGNAGNGPFGDRSGFYGRVVFGGDLRTDVAWSSSVAMGGFSGTFQPAVADQFYVQARRNNLISPEHCTITFDVNGITHNGRIRALRGGTGGTLLDEVELPIDESDFVNIIQIWNHFTWDILVSDAGHINVWYRGVPVLSVDGDTQVGTDPAISHMRFGASTTTDLRFCDYYLFDPGASIYSAPFDDTVIFYVAPDASGTHADSTIGGSSPAPTRLESIFEQIQDDGVTLNELSAQGDKDSFENAYGDLLDLDWRVVQLIVRARKVGAGNAEVAGILRNVGGTEHQTASKVLTTNWETLVVPMELSPFSSSFWVPGEIDEVGYVADVLDPGTTIEVSQVGLEIATEAPVAGGVMHMKTLD